MSKHKAIALFSLTYLAITPTIRYTNKARNIQGN
jgi:hypothetical protein